MWVEAKTCQIFMEHKYITMKGECKECKHKGKKGKPVKAKPAKAAAKAVVDAFN